MKLFYKPKQPKVRGYRRQKVTVIGGKTDQASNRKGLLRYSVVSMAIKLALIAIAATIAYGVVLTMGKPHVRTEYRYQGSREQPLYVHCTYKSWNSIVVVEFGDCPMVRWF